MKSGSIHQVHTLISSSLKQAVKWGWLEHNVAANTTRPPVRHRCPSLEKEKGTQSMRSTPARRLYTVREVALLLGVSKSAAYGMVQRGEIPIVDNLGPIRVTIGTIESMLGERPPPPHEVHLRASGE